MKQPIPSQAIQPGHLASIYEQGRAARRLCADYANPYGRGTPEQRKYYEGWCAENMRLFDQVWWHQW